MVSKIFANFKFQSMMPYSEIDVPAQMMYNNREAADKEGETMKKLLIIEDDAALGQGIRLALQGDVFDIQISRCAAQGKKALAAQQFDLVILDINLPDANGLDILSELRRKSTVPVIMLTANDMETDIVTALESGADDYITKPFSLAVLRARVNACLRRQRVPTACVVEMGDLCFNFERMEFFKDGKAVSLSKTEQKLLRILIENRGRTLSRAALIDRIWTDGAAYVDENALSVTVKRLRDKLEDVPSKPQYLKTVYGIGYTWEGK